MTPLSINLTHGAGSFIGKQLGNYSVKIKTCKPPSLLFCCEIPNLSKQQLERTPRDSCFCIIAAGRKVNRGFKMGCKFFLVANFDENNMVDRGVLFSFFCDIHLTNG